MAGRAARAVMVNVSVDASLRGSAFCRAQAEATDRWLGELFAAALDGQDPSGLALVAVGGYGRGELCPQSDIDVVLVDATQSLRSRHAGGRGDRKDVAQLAERIWYPVWDAGVKLGHAVRTIKAATSLAATSLETATAMLDVRLLAGDQAVADDQARRAADQWHGRASLWLAALGRSVRERHERSGEVAFLLEPDLKEGRGGLRDAHALRWAEAAHRILVEGDHDALAAAYETVLAARVELQRRTGKASDRLLLQEQDGVAEALGDPDADALMARLAAAARTIAWTSDETWQRIDASLAGPKGRGAGRDHAVGRGLVMREDVVELAPGTDPAADAGLVLRAAAAAATAATRIGRSSLERLAADTAPLSEPWPDEDRRNFLRLLGAGTDALPVLEALDQKGILVRLVPEWVNVRSLPQRNAYHRFTVDRHLSEAAAQAAGLAARVHRPDLLVLGAWLHDIGKGFGPGDHSHTGVPVAEAIATRMGYPPRDVAVLAKLVRHHLLLPDAATRRDLQDAATIEAVAEAVGDAGTLELLHALTEADSIATGPAAWSEWKAGLVADLVGRVARALAGEPHETEDDDFPTPAQRELMERVKATGDLVVDGQGHDVTLAAPDRPALFCRMAGALALHNLDVLAARVWSTDDGVAVEEFRVQPAYADEVDWEAVETDCRRVLTGRLSLEARLAERARTYASRTRVTSAEPARTSVVVDNDVSPSATVVEVRAPDRIGTLYRITRALADLELDVRHAKVQTLGHEVVDVFYVVDQAGGKLDDGDHRREVQRAILTELSRA
jgi:[protein-PII] uridylyltransferase